LSFAHRPKSHKQTRENCKDFISFHLYRQCNRVALEKQQRSRQHPKLYPYCSSYREIIIDLPSHHQSIQ
jgi:hypothetical protein